MKTAAIYVFTLSLYFISSTQIHAQNVGINATGASPADAAALDIDMTTKGLLIPRVALTSTTVFAPVTGTSVVSLLIYNTSTAGISPTNVTPGFYYWDGTQWVRLQTGSSTTNWTLLGNAGTSSATNFLGTTDNVDLIFRRNNTRGGRIGETSTSLGLNALNTASTGPQNTAIGVNSLSSHTTSFNNTAVGYNSLMSLTNFGGNTAVGANSLRMNNGAFNTALGSFALQNSTTGWANIGIGYGALQNGALTDGNIAIGYSALANNNGSSNIALGYAAAQNSTGSRNVTMGHQSFDNGGGNDNVSIGYNANMFNASGNNNVIIGSWQTTGWANSTFSRQCRNW